MENTSNDSAQKQSNLVINIISIVVPLIVAVLLGAQNKLELGVWTKNLPHAIGLINTLTTVALVLGVIFIKLKKISLHQAMMTLAFCFGGVFLICYILYHISNPSNKFAGTGTVRYIYFFTLISHIGMSLIVLPLVLRAMYFAATKQFSAHRKIVKFAYPIWLYVSVTGVMIYLFVYQLFPSN
jgi:putative membrane protein